MFLPRLVDDMTEDEWQSTSPFTPSGSARSIHQEGPLRVKRKIAIATLNGLFVGFDMANLATVCTFACRGLGIFTAPTAIGIG